jgi:hypothetical protein
MLPFLVGVVVGLLLPWGWQLARDLFTRDDGPDETIKRARKAWK